MSAAGGAGSDVIAMLVADHREVERMFTELENTPRGDVAAHREKSARVIAELVRHSVAEEQWLYPAVREMVPDGKEIADHEIAEHAEAEQTMKRLERADPVTNSEEYMEHLNRLISEIRHHVEDEEKDLFPKLSEAASTERLEDLGAKVKDAKEKAPTRPHPSAPDTPPSNRLLDPGAGLVDRIRDALSGRNV